jgi:hypothetical protein
MRIPVTFECQPSPSQLPDGSLPDELMIDWGSVPTGATASIYLPQADADGILKTARSLYGGQYLALEDGHTVVCQAANVTYIPIPSGSPAHYAGLLTLNLPSGAPNRGCKVIARQITNATTATFSKRSLGAPGIQRRRKVLGAFQLTVTVGTPRALLEPEERLLAFFRWILSRLARNDRWHPVIERYLVEIATRVKDFGGNPDAIAPSQVGAVLSSPETPPQGHSPGAGRLLDCSGKIEGLIHDRFGDFDGFILRTDSGTNAVFHTRARHFVEVATWAWRAQLRVTVTAQDGEPDVPARIVLHAPQA